MTVTRTHQYMRTLVISGMIKLSNTFCAFLTITKLSLAFPSCHRGNYDSVGAEHSFVHQASEYPSSGSCHEFWCSSEPI